MRRATAQDSSTERVPHADTLRFFIARRFIARRTWQLRRPLLVTLALLVLARVGWFVLVPGMAKYF